MTARTHPRAAFPRSPALNLTGDYGLVHDPSLTRRGTDGKYFLFCTGDNGPIRTSDDLIVRSSLPPRPNLASLTALTFPRLAALDARGNCLPRR